jgi:NTE family protein
MGVPEPALIVGTSMGAIVGGLYACGMSAAELTRFALEDFDIAEYLDSFVFKINGLVGKVLQTGQILGSLASKTGMDSGLRMLKLFERLTEGKTFGETKIPFRCNAVDLASGKQVVFGRENSTASIARAMRASMSFPIFFAPFIDEGRCLVDGGLADNMPVFVARQEGFRRVLAVQVGAFQPVPPAKLQNGTRLIFRCIETGLELMRYQSPFHANLTIHAENASSPIDFSQKKELIALGEQATNAGDEAVRAFFSTDIRSTLTRKRYVECGITYATPESPCL